MVFFILLVYCVLVGLLTESKMHFFWRGFLGIFFSECAEILSSWKFGEGKIFLTFCSFVLPPCFTILNKYIMHACFVFLLYQMYLKVCIRQKKYLLKVCRKSLANHENLWWPVVVDLDMGKAEKCICILAKVQYSRGLRLDT